MHFEVIPQGVCCREIRFDINDDKVSNVKFIGGCPGNLKIISKLIEGWTIDKIEKEFLGNTCAIRKTSCVDQFAILVRKAYEESKNI